MGVFHDLCGGHCGFTVLFSALHLDFEQACVLVFAALNQHWALLDVMMLPEIDLIAAPILFNCRLRWR